MPCTDETRTPPRTRTHHAHAHTPRPPLLTCLACSLTGRYVPYTDETRFRAKWLRGPFSPVQGNLDHLLVAEPHKIPAELRERQNERYRELPV